MTEITLNAGEVAQLHLRLFRIQKASKEGRPQNRQAMLHQVSNPEVPIEATFKWLVKENKRLKDREALLTEYAKRLEDYTKRRAEKAARYSKAELQAINHGHRKG